MMKGKVDDICGGDMRGRPFSNTGLALQEVVDDIAVDCDTSSRSV
jgi:hypothetical protein